MRARKGLTVSLVAAAVLAVPGVALAATVYQGADYAFNTGNTKVTTCDKEDDAHRVYSDFTATWGNGRNWSPGYNQCGAVTTNYIRSFNVCEQISYFPDACSSRVYV